MKKKYFIGSTLAALLLASCASQFAFIAPQTCAEATMLKNSCSKLPHDIEERMYTDSLYNQGAAFIRTGNNEKAYVLLDRAIVRYRLLLVRHTIAKKEREIEQLKHDVAEDVDELSTCLRKIEIFTSSGQP